MRAVHKALLLALLFSVLGVCIISSLSPSVEGNSGWQIDLLCEYGGGGKNVACPVPFVAGANITLWAYVTYNQAPVLSVLVAFQVDKPNGSQLLVSVRQTNASGYAATNFKITENLYPIFPSNWNCTATTSPAQDSISDSMPFRVLPRLVGGISMSIPPLAAHTQTRTLFVEILIAPALLIFAKFRKRAK